MTTWHIKANPVRPPPPIQAPPDREKQADILVATTWRPDLLDACLSCIGSFQIPADWNARVLVCGEPGDPGEHIARKHGAQWVTVERGAWVTDKFNALLTASRGELIVLCDDDDLQPPERLQAAIAAHEGGARWSGVGSWLHLHLGADSWERWTGPAGLGLVGTSLSFRRSVLLQVGGWPRRKKGKDAPIATKIGAAGFRDITGEMDPIVTLSHGGNLWDRRVVAPGESDTRGEFVVEGIGAPCVVQGSVLRCLRHQLGRRGPFLGVTTYQRPALCRSLLSAVGAGAETHVWDDESADPPQIPTWATLHTHGHRGKRGYHLTISEFARTALAYSCDYAILLQDDVRPCANFLRRVGFMWASIPKKDLGSLYLLRDTSGDVPRWGSPPPVSIGGVMETGWVDCAAAVFSRAALELMTDIPAPGGDWLEDPKRSSGVGRFVSRALRRKGLRMYRTKRSYVRHDGAPSLMNPEQRAAAPMLTTDWIDE